LTYYVLIICFSKRHTHYFNKNQICKGDRDKEETRRKETKWNEMGSEERN